MTCDTKSIVEWLMDGARSASRPEDVMGELCQRLVACGVPLWRAGVFVRTLHPEITGRRFLWMAGAEVTVGEMPYETAAERLRDSPVAYVHATGLALRRRLRHESECAAFTVLHELRAEGATDYLASPLHFIDGSVHVATWATKDPEGFDDSQIAAIETIIAPLARVAEIRALHRTASNLLSTYVGHHAGERILAGRIRRGHTELIHAAIWLSDMRGFTGLADRVPLDELIELLNHYFDCQVPAIVGHGGEVLKFMGDGLLAIFPVDGDRARAGAVCDAALASGKEARESVAALSASDRIAGIHTLRFGLALHVGDVLYGNIGGGNRLDFTCIGPAVNLAARLEKLAGRLGRAVLTSGEFAQHCGEPLAPVGSFALPGLPGEQLVYGFGDEETSLRPPASGSP